MTEYIPVSPGINLSRLLAGGRLTKKFVREAMRDHPEWDWNTLTVSGGTYVNGEDCIRHDMILQVMDGGTTVAMVHFQPDVTKPYGFQAVVS